MNSTNVKEKKVETLSNEEYSFRPKDLKNIFPELKSEEEFSLIPIFDRITRMFMVDLKQNPSEYSVSSFRYASKDESIPHCHYFENGRIYDLNTADKGKVSINMHKIDINPVSNLNLEFSRRHYWMTNKVTINGNKHQRDTLSNLLKSFIQKQNLERLTKESKQELLELEAYRTDTGFARPQEFHDFYFEEKIETRDDDIL
jgi:hypothetical protein